MGRDSNPRYPIGYSSFQDCRLSPLGHPSETRNAVIARGFVAWRTRRSFRGRPIDTFFDTLLSLRHGNDTHRKGTGGRQ